MTNFLQTYPLKSYGKQQYTDQKKIRKYVNTYFSEISKERLRKDNVIFLTLVWTCFNLIAPHYGIL